MNESVLMRGQIYWMDLNPASGSEQGGFRPVLVLSNKLINDRSPVVMVAPLTRYQHGKRRFPTDVLIESTDVTYIQTAITDLKKQGHTLDVNYDSVFIGNQSRSISKKRLIKHVGTINNDDILKRINNVISQVFAITACDLCFFPMDSTNLLCPNPMCKKKHRKKCFSCNKVMSLSYKYCHECGKEV